MQRLVLQMQLCKPEGKILSLPTFQFTVQCNGSPSKEGSTLLSCRGSFHYPIPATYCMQESVIFLLRKQINPFLSKFFKGFFLTTSLRCHMSAPLLLDCPHQGQRQNPSSYLDHSQEQPTLY